jgi:hypothetical protein
VPLILDQLAVETSQQRSVVGCGDPKREPRVQGTGLFASTIRV